MGLSLLPWGFVLLGLLPLWLFPRKESLYPGVVFLLAALLLAAAASLYARAPLGPRVRFFWVLGLGLLGCMVAVAASRDLAQVPEDVAVVASLAGLMGTGALLLGLLFWQEVPGLPLGPSKTGVLPRAMLEGLAPSLEVLSRARPITLLLLHAPTDLSGSELLPFLRPSDMVFALAPDRFLVVLQGSSPEGAQVVFRRIRQGLPIQAYGVMPLQGGSLKQALRQLEAELEHFYLTQP
ncbi:diguanylate cyclase [Meiothermus rufus]|uniref:diguanylate cyclase n=1 Tax=Meiothermus rufus TaxID=604332 RepID=UPI000419E569|nr:diguanylate cyclase [Meiothermus rufus]